MLINCSRVLDLMTDSARPLGLYRQGDGERLFRYSLCSSSLPSSFDDLFLVVSIFGLFFLLITLLLLGSLSEVCLGSPPDGSTIKKQKR